MLLRNSAKLVREYSEPPSVRVTIKTTSQKWKNQALIIYCYGISKSLKLEEMLISPIPFSPLKGILIEGRVGQHRQGDCLNVEGAWTKRP